MTHKAMIGMRLALALCLSLGVLALGLGPIPARAEGDMFSPAVTVNGTVVTRYEVAQRLAFLQVLQQTGDLEKRAVEDLIADRLQMDAAKSLGVNISDQDVGAGMTEFAARANLSAEELAGFLWSKRIRYLGVGALLVGGIWTLISLRHSLASGVRSGLAAARASAARPCPLTPQL